jgi:exosortase A-associated hydrolase 2
MSGVTETFYIEESPHDLLAHFDAPAGDIHAGIVMVHPFGEEKKCAHRALYETAKALCDKGIAVLRFDLSGCGDSEGAFAECRTTAWRADIVAAHGELQRRIPGKPTALLGLRMGAALAAEAVAEIGGLSALILWQPLINGKTEFTGELRRLLIQQMVTHGKSTTKQSDLVAQLERGDGEVELDGYPVTGPMFQDICALDTQATLQDMKTPTGILHFTRPARRAVAMAEALDIAQATVAVPPIWIRSDFLANRETGKTLAVEGVLPFLQSKGDTP